MILDDQQRLIFIEYCRRQAESAEAICEQFEKLNLSGPAQQQMTKREKLKAACYSFVAQDLMSMTTTSVSPGETGDTKEVLDKPEHNENKVENHPDTRFD